jgi:large subunit ribosomal protein L29
MDIKELRGKSPAELNEHLAELRKEQFNLRMARGTGQLAKTHEFVRVRREIARVKTLLGQKRQ